MTDHDYFEQLAALDAGGFLTEEESTELREHINGCLTCLKSQEEFHALFQSGLPLTTGSLWQFFQSVTTKTDDHLRSRFLARARREGLVFSPAVERPSTQRMKRFGTALTATVAVAATLLLALYGTRFYRGTTSQESAQSRQQLEKLQQQNSALTATVSQLHDSVAAQQREIQSLRTQLGTANKTAETFRQDSEQARAEGQRSSSQVVQLPAELQNQDKQLEDARREIDRINQLRAGDEASLVAQQVRIAELSDQLRIASATLELERQLTAAGKDIRELLVARQLHVIDVRDTDVHGKPSKAFGRIFVTEGKSLTFYAFDLGEERTIDAKHRFEVWGTQRAKDAPAQKLGFFYVDDKVQRRWALKVDDPQLVKEVNSVFVTVEPAGGAPSPSPQTMLYAFLGQPNHP